MGSDLMQESIPPPPPGFTIVSGGASPPPAPRPAPARAAPRPAASSQPRGIRNNNPGNIEDGEFARSLPGYAGSDGRFARFENADAGSQAAPRLLASYVRRGFDTPAEIINRWAPPSDNNPTAQYASYVASRAGVGVNDPITPDKIPVIAQAIHEFENGQTRDVGSSSAPAASVPPPPPGFEVVASPLDDLNIHRPENVDMEAAAALGQSAYTGPGSSEANPLEVTADTPRDVLMSLTKGMWIKTPEGVRRLSGDAYVSANAGDGAPETRIGNNAVLREENLADQTRAFAMGAAEQIPFLDEAAVGAAGLISGRGYSDVRDSYRAVQDIDNQVNREQRVAGGIAGAATGLLAPGGGFLKGSSGLLSASARSAALGSGYGALYGAGAADGGLEDRAAGAVGGAVAGGLLGVTAPAAVNIGRSVVQRTGSGLAEAGARVQRGVGIQPREAAITPRTTESALDYVQRIASNSGVDLAANPVAAMGKPITAAEALGPNGVSQMVALTRRSGRTAGLAEGALGARAADQPTRVLQDFADITGADPSGSADVIANLAAAGRTRAAPLYDAAYSRAGAPRSPLIDDLMTRPSSQKAFARAVTIAREEGRDPTTLGFQFDEAGDTIHVREPSMQTMDYIKRGMDDGLNAYRDSTTRRLNLDERGRAELRTLTAFRNELERLNPAYRDALAAGGDPIRLEEAFRQAAQLFGTGVNERTFAQRVSGMAEADRRAVIAGLADDLYTKARNGRLRPNQLDNPSFRGKLAQLVGEEGTGSFIARVQAEVSLARTGGRMAPNVNSTTGEALEAIREQDQGVGFGADMARNIEQSGPFQGLLRTGADAIAAPIAGFVRGAQAPAPQGVRDEIGRLLLMDPEELRGLLTNRPRRPAVSGGLLRAPATAGQAGGLLAQ